MDFWSSESGTVVIERAVLACAVALVISVMVGSGLGPGAIVRRVAVIAEVFFAGGKSETTIPEPISREAPQRY
jgi:hypothetical protein